MPGRHRRQQRRPAGRAAAGWSPEPQGGGSDRPKTAVLTYDDGPHDAEALLVHPRTGQTLVVTKTLLAASVYEAPRCSPDGRCCERVGTFVPRSTGTEGGPVGAVARQRLVTGGAVSPDGRRLALRTYTDAYVVRGPGRRPRGRARRRPAGPAAARDPAGRGGHVRPPTAPRCSPAPRGRRPVHRVPCRPQPRCPPRRSRPRPAGDRRPRPAARRRADPTALLGRPRSCSPASRPRWHCCGVAGSSLPRPPAGGPRTVEECA